ncbi:MAG: M20/M25/M40 family metallo-hydrolase, partial [Clostridium sp.]
DEIGFIVRYIEDDGIVRIHPVGYHDDRMVINQDMVIFTESGYINGITGSRPPHIITEEERSKVISIYDIGIDVGTFSKEETEKLGVRIGDYAAYKREGFFLNGDKVYTGKAVDNRAGCTVMAEVVRRLTNENLKSNIYAVGSVQEEVGIRGAGTAAHNIKPDIAIVIDVTIAGGALGVELSEVPIKIGHGVALKLYDWDPSNMVGNAMPKKIARSLIKIAEDNNIAYQREVVMNCGTDAWSISLSGDGVTTIGLSIPERYIHTAVGTVHMDDLESAVRLIVEYIKSIDK